MAKGKARPFDGQVAIVTGGGDPVGRAVALALAARGVRIVVTGREERALGETVGEIAYQGGKARHLVGDVRDPTHGQAAVAKALETFGGALDIVIAGAGVYEETKIGGDLARAEAVIQTNLVGAYYVFDAALRAMKGPGRLLAIGSALAESTHAAHAAHALSRAGLIGLVETVALEVAPRRITCNAVAGSDADEVAEIAVFLCSDAGGAISGQRLVVGDPLSRPSANAAR